MHTCLVPTLQALPNSLPKVQNIKVIKWWKPYQFQVRLYPIRLVSGLNKLAKTTRIWSNVFQKQYLMYWLLYSDNIKNWWNCIWILHFKATVQTTFHQWSSSQTKMHGPNVHRYPCNKRNLDANVHVWTSHYKVYTTTNECIALIYAICTTSKGGAPHVCTGIG